MPRQIRGKHVEALSQCGHETCKVLATAEEPMQAQQWRPCRIACGADVEPAAHGLIFMPREQRQTPGRR